MVSYDMSMVYKEPGSEFHEKVVLHYVYLESIL